MHPALHRRTALALLLVVAGCLAPTGNGPTATSGGPTAPTEGPTATTPTTQPSPTSPSTTEPTRSQTPDPPVDATPANTVNYSALTDRQQAAFREAIDGEVSFVPQSPHVDDDAGYPYELVGVFREHEYVRRGGRYYAPSFSSGKLYATYQVSATPGEPGPDETVVDFEDVPGDLQNEVREAVETGSYTAPFGKWDSLPPGLPRYVRYGNETYQLGFAVGDSWATVMTVERVD